MSFPAAGHRSTCVRSARGLSLLHLFFPIECLHISYLPLSSPAGTKTSVAEELLLLPPLLTPAGSAVNSRTLRRSPLARCSDRFCRPFLLQWAGCFLWPSSLPWDCCKAPQGMDTLSSLLLAMCFPTAPASNGTP